jgi:hypothetical protein
LDGIALIEVLELNPWCQTATVKEDFVAPVVRNDKAKAFLADDLFDGSSHR